MPHGGARTGAGRPKKLDFIQRLWIGSRCEELFVKELKSKLKKLIESDELFEDYHTRVERLYAIPLDKRPAYLRSEAMDAHRDEVNIETRQAIARDLKRDGQTDEAIRIENGNEPLGIVVFRYQASKPQGCRQKIIAQVLNESQQRYPEVGLARRTIDKCWKEARAFERELRSESDI